jgi:L-threonylcarbamoyladenylate synthase
VTPEDVAAFDDCIAAGGVALFPADTVYGLAADPESRAAVERLHDLKRRPAARPAAVMFFSVGAALAALPELGPRTRAAVERVLPGGLTLIVPNAERRYPLACGPAPDRLGLRVPDLRGPLEPLGAATRPVLQSSANPTGGSDPRRLADVHPSLLSEVDAVLDGGDLPGTPSTVIDLTRYESGGGYDVLRDGAVRRAELDALL